MKSCANIYLTNHSQDKMIKEKQCPRTSWNYNNLGGTRLSKTGQDFSLLY